MEEERQKDIDRVTKIMRQRNLETERHKSALFSQNNDNIRSLREELIEKIGIG